MATAFFKTLHAQAIVLAAKPGELGRLVRDGMQGRRRYRAPRRPRIPPSASIAPVAQHRGGDTQLACDLDQRPAAAHQQGYRLSLELIGELTPSLAHSTPFRSLWSLAKVSTNSREPQLRVRSLARSSATRPRLAPFAAGRPVAKQRVRRSGRARIARKAARMLNLYGRLAV
jgi:hypothetical protein